MSDDPLTRLTGARKNPAPRVAFTDVDDNECSALDFLRRRLRLPIASIAKLGTDLDAEFDLKLDDDATVRLGTAGDVLMQNRARAAIAASAAKVVPRLKPAEWDQVVAAILQIAVTIDTHATTNSETRGWLAAFVRAAGTRVDDDDREQFADALADETASRALIANGRLYVQLGAFEAWVNHSRRESISASQLATRLVRLGFTNHREQVRRPAGPQARRRLWHSPAGFDPAADPDDGDDTA